MADPIQELKNRITDRIHENHEQAIDGEDLQEMLHDVVDCVTGHLATETPDKHFVHDQGTPAEVWFIQHNLGKKPSVMVLDSAGSEVIGAVKVLDDNNIRITFSSSFSGKATFN
jgi:hypothetical protein